MKTTTDTNDKRNYSSPKIEQIKIDHEISLALASDPPAYESKYNSKTPDYFNNEPFKMNLS